MDGGGMGKTGEGNEITNFIFFVAADTEIPVNKIAADVNIAILFFILVFFIFDTLFNILIRFYQIC